MATFEIKAPPLSQFIGQEKLIKLLLEEVAASRINGKPLSHMIFGGPPGLGKSLLIGSIADARGVNIVKFMGPQMTEKSIAQACCHADISGHDKNGRVVDRRAIKPSIIWIDECDGMSTKLFESIHDILEPTGDRRVFMAKIQGNSNPKPHWFPECSWAFTTNYLGKMKKRGAALVNRCAIRYMFEPYEVKELVKILLLKAKAVPVTLNEDAAERIAQRSVGIPRTANLLFQRCVNRLVIANNRPAQFSDRVTLKLVDTALEMLGIDDLGLEAPARMYLKALAQQPAAKMGLDSLAATVGVDKETLAVDIEPFLMRLGLVRVTGGGRQITDLGLTHIGLENANPLAQRRINNF